MRNLLLGIGLVFYFSMSLASPFGAKLCRENPNFDCVKVGSDTWKKIATNAETRQLIKLINRVNIGLSGTVAVPKNLENATRHSLSPFPERMPAAMEKILIIDLEKLAWAAYGKNGLLLKWGAISPGKDKCPEDNSSCRTTTGKFSVYRKQGADCYSRKYPLPFGGAPMPYCSFFNGGIAVHAGMLPGRPDSHGCVRTDMADAKWLSQEFLTIGTQVHVRPYR
ncbi:MAG: L,D-transpeptidase [Legionellales bacterium]|nr:L,D-transpeptidase [Legionellales bacterium]